MLASEESGHSRMAYAPAPSSELGEDEDLLHEELSAEADAKIMAETTMADANSSEIADFVASESLDTSSTNLSEATDDLQPGGVGSGVQELVKPNTKGNILDSMTIKELRRLAEQKGITVTVAMRKHQLIDAIRGVPVSTPAAITAFDVPSTIAQFDAPSV